MRLTNLITLALVSVVSATAAQDTPSQHKVKPFMGMLELIEPEWESEDGRSSKRHFHHVAEGNKTVHLHYEVEHPEDVYILKVDKKKHNVVDVDCAKDHVTLTFPTHEEAKAQAEKLVSGSLLSGHRHWKCVNEHGAPQNLLRKVVTAEHKDNTVHMETKEANYGEFFKNAKIDFYVDHFPEDHFHEVLPILKKAGVVRSEAEAAVSKDGQERRKLGFLGHVFHSVGHALSHAWSSVKKVAKKVATTVKDVAKTVETVVEVAVTGKFDYDKTKTLKTINWNFDEDKQSSHIGKIPIDTDIACSNCYLHADVQLRFQLHIEHYKLKDLEITATGNARGMLAADFTASFDKEWSYEKQVAHLKMVPITLFIGVPVTLDFDVPIQLGFNANFKASAAAHAHAQFSGSLTYGVKYAGGKFQMISTNDLQHSGSIDAVGGKVSAFLNIYTIPTLILTIEKIGGPSVGVKPYLEIAAEVLYGNPEYVGRRRLSGVDSDCLKTGGMQLTVNFGLQVTVGAQIHISIAGHNIYHKDWPQHSVYSMKKPILSGCHRFKTLGRERRYLTQSKNLVGSSLIVESGKIQPGNTYSGKMVFTSKNQEKCAKIYGGGLQFPKLREVSIQVLSQLSDHEFKVATAVNVAQDGSSNSNFAMLRQRSSILTNYGTFGTIIEDMKDAEDEMNYEACTLESEMDARPITFLCRYDDASPDVFLCSDDYGCFSSELSRRHN